TDTADDPARRVKRPKKCHASRPGSIRVEYDISLGNMCVVNVEQPAKHLRASFVIEQHRILSCACNLRVDDANQLRHWTCDVRLEFWVLLQDGREQRRAGSRQA